jgi:predicted lipoprotein with Yx(FWY)xxD motif
MTKKRLPVLTAIVAIIAIVAVITATSGGAQRPTPRAAAGSAISVAQTPVGKALVDANGRTLYLFALDQPNVSRLSAAGQSVWPPFTSAVAPAAKGGASAAQIAVIPATKQVTYNGHPLYYYVGDQHTGQTAGQGLNEFGARWYVLSASGAANTSTAPSGSASPEGSVGEGGTSGY